MFSTKIYIDSFNGLQIRVNKPYSAVKVCVDMPDDTKGIFDSAGVSLWRCGMLVVWCELKLYFENIIINYQ